MVIAMLAGMLGLGTVINALPGGSALFHPPVLSALVMATNMTIGMSLWMRFRRHSWRSIAEMSAAMYFPFIILFVPFWTGLLSGHLVMIGGHILMLPAMVAAMLPPSRRVHRQPLAAHLFVRGLPSRPNSERAPRMRRRQAGLGELSGLAGD
jgi:uncharacterized membrane protein YfcA